MKRHHGHVERRPTPLLRPSDRWMNPAGFTRINISTLFDKRIRLSHPRSNVNSVDRALSMLFTHLQAPSRQSIFGWSRSHAATQ